MENGLFIRVLQDISNHRYNIDVLTSKFYVENSTQLIDYVLHTFKENLSAFLLVPSFRTMYHTFLYNLTDAIKDPGDLYSLNVCIKNNIKTVKELLKPYNKGIKEKDKMYNKLIRLKQDLESNLSYSEQKVYKMYEDDNVKVLKHIIFDLKDPDILYHVISIHKGIVNLYTNEEHILEHIIRYFVREIDNMEDKDINYFKRVITMFLISDKIDISREKLEGLQQDLNYQLSRETDKALHLNYINGLIDKYLNKWKPSLYTNKEIIVPRRLVDGRMDLRSLPTITIDQSQISKTLFDDAFSIQDKEDGTYYIYVHIPDVDEYIQSDKEFDDYMKNISISRYSRTDKTPMIPYDISSRMSLKEGNDIACLSFRLHVDKQGNVLGINFFKSVINVDNNLSRNKANLLFNSGEYKYIDELEQMAAIAKMLRKKRSATVGKRTKSGLIMDEFNIWANIATASFFNDNGILFPYRNFVPQDYNSLFIENISKFLDKQKLDTDAKVLLLGVPDTESRMFYSTTNYGNAHFNRLPYGSVGNPMREYMSLETSRLIKSLLIDEDATQDDWRERIESECIEHTEIFAKVKELYKTTK